MKATELSLGNWFEIKDQEVKTYAQIEGVGNLQLAAGQLWSIEELEPIPLTEEWLERFGFEWDGEMWFHKAEDWIMIDLSDNMVRLWDGWLYREIKYVHTLQNLYHALTGEELTVKE